MKLDVNELRSVYNYDTDTHNSEYRTRYMWKYTAARSVGGTPSAFVNGVKLLTVPTKGEDWLRLVTDVYNSQVKVPTMGMEPIEMVIRRSEK